LLTIKLQVHVILLSILLLNLDDQAV